MEIKTCEHYVLNELENTKEELILVKKQLEEKNNYIKKSYFRLFNKLLGYVTNVDISCDDDGKFEIKTIDFGEKEKAMIFEIENNDHLNLNEFIAIVSKYIISDEPLIYKEELDNIFVYANQLEELVNLIK